MTPMPGNDSTLPPVHHEKPKFHPGGDCECLRKHRRIDRYQDGYGHCANCGKLTRNRIRTRIVRGRVG